MIAQVEIDTRVEDYLREHQELLLETYPKGVEIKSLEERTSTFILEYIGQRADRYIQSTTGRRYAVYGLKRTSGRRPSKKKD